MNLKMQNIHLGADNIDEAVRSSVGALNAGGVVLYPTDTLYGLGADALSDSAVDKIYSIKGREEDKPIHAIVADMAMAEKYAVINDFARKLSNRFSPGPQTLILKKQKGLQSGITRKLDTIGVRIPNNSFCTALAREFGGPITATSANKSGLPPPRSVDKILEQLGRKASLIDLIIDAGELPLGAPSTVVDVARVRPIVLREGAIAAADIWDELDLSKSALVT